MKTEQLIRAMAADTARSPQVTVLLAGAVLAAAALVAALFLPVLGVRPDLGAALTRLPVLLKQAYPAALAIAALRAWPVLTRSHGDLLPCNVLVDGAAAHLVDLECAGDHPEARDHALLWAHLSPTFARPSRPTLPSTMVASLWSWWTSPWAVS